MKKYFKYIILCLGILFFSGSKVLAATCNKTLISGDTSSGVVCTYHTNSPDYCTASCASGWDTSCDSDEYISSTSEVRCYINDSNCNNIARCYDCAELSCGSKTHLGDCPTWLGFEETNCTVTYPGGNPYTCCDCTQSTECVYNSDCNDGNDCTSDYCNTSTGACSYTTITTGDCADEEPPDYDECYYPYCLDSGYHIATNCSGDCETENYWLDTEYYICCAPGYNYICDRWCYPDQTYGNCSYCNGPCRYEECPTTCHTAGLNVPDGSQSDGQCQLKYCPATTPINGVCGASNGGTFLTAPTVNLCSTGTPSSVTTSGYTYFWTCSGNCTGTVAGCVAYANSPPSFQSLVLRSNDNDVVYASAGSRNQICQTEFDGSNTINVTVYATDPDGVADINDIQLKWNGIIFTRNSLVNGVANFSHTFDSTQYSVNTYDFQVVITDSVNNTTGWITSNRYFKFWDCKVPISGTFYDGTDGSNCGTGEGFVTPADSTVLNLKSLVFTGGGIGVNMETINSPNYSSGTNYLTWGVNTYVPSFNADISLSEPKLRFKTSPTSSWNCPTNPYVDTTGVDPYSTDPMMITADFTGVLVQDPWFQAQNGGVISNINVVGQVPVTCTNDNCKISIDGLVAAPSISNSGNTSSYQNWYYGSTSGLSNSNAKLADYNTNYDYFYSQYFVKKAVGTISVGKTITSVSDLGSDTNGIYFINGNLDINGDVINSGNFLMIIAKEKITVDQSVNRVDGVLVASDIGASGASGDQLVFNGSLYASNTINFSRDFSSRVTNNSTPAVVVNYDPKLIFNMPGDIAKVLTNWQWGN